MSANFAQDLLTYDEGQKKIQYQVCYRSDREPLPIEKLHSLCQKAEEFFEKRVTKHVPEQYRADAMSNSGVPIFGEFVVGGAGGDEEDAPYVQLSSGYATARGVHVSRDFVKFTSERVVRLGGVTFTRALPCDDKSGKPISIIHELADRHSTLELNFHDGLDGANGKVTFQIKITPDREGNRNELFFHIPRRLKKEFSFENLSSVLGIDVSANSFKRLNTKLTSTLTENLFKLLYTGSLET